MGTSLRPRWEGLNVEDVAAGVGVEVAGQRWDPAGHEDFVAELLGVKNTGTSADVKIQDTFDDGATWQDWITFAQLTADGSEVVAAARAPAGEVRVLRTSVGDSWDLRVRVSSDLKR